MPSSIQEYVDQMRSMYAERLATCKSCEHLRPVINQCKECGCFVYAKTAIESAKCPLGKWG